MDFGDEKFRAPPPPSAASEREHMFDKVVTPSDVGKLNRLVIPKQHAEKYLPLDTTANEKGLLLSFEDRNGKPWRFRYSYWNSSQSYVMTKGWSRFVKEKRLDAGDTVSFGRCTSAPDRFFIDWKRRPDAAPAAPYHRHHQLLSFARSPASPWGGGNFFGIYGCNATGASASASAAGAAVYFQSPVAALPPPQVTVLDSVPLVHRHAAAKRVRLFGVNLDCPESNGGDEEDGYRSTQLRLGSGRASSVSSPQQSSLDLDL